MFYEKNNIDYFPQVYKSFIDLSTQVAPMLCGLNINQINNLYTNLFSHIPTIKEWLDIYDDEKGILIKIWELFQHSFHDKSSIIELFEFHIMCYDNRLLISNNLVTFFNSISDDKKIIFLSILHDIDLISYFVDESLIDDYVKKIEIFNNRLHNDLMTADNNSVQEKSYIFNNEILFIMKVIVPCFINHKQLPFAMMKNARNGCEDDISKLLEIDKSIIFDESISRHIHYAYMSNNSMFESIQKVYATNTNTLNKENRIYLFIATQFKLSKLYHKLGYPKLTIPTLSKPFEKLFPENFLNQSDSIRRRVSRLLEQILCILNPDKK